MGCRLLRIALMGDIATLRRITLRPTRIATRATGVTALRRIHLLIDGIHHVNALIRGHAHSNEARHCASLVTSSVLHSSTGCTGHEGCTGIRVSESLLVADISFVFFASLNAAHTEGYNLNTAQIAPFLTQNLVELVANFLGMTGQRAIAYTLSAHGTKGTIQARQKLTLELTIDFAA